MIQEYPVFCRGERIGRVQLEKQGLYYRLSCRCGMGDGMYRLTAACGDKRTDLGTLVPMGDGFGMDTRFPAKRMGEGEFCFSIHPKTEGTFVPIRPEEPFAYIERLKHSFLTIQNGQKGIVIPAADGTDHEDKKLKKC